MLPREIEAVFAALVVVIMGLVWLAKRRPDIKWLRHFRGRELSQAERERKARRANRYAGVELILAGIVLPMGYVALTVMMFNSFDPLWTTLVAIASIGCIAIGITAIVKS